MKTELKDIKVSESTKELLSMMERCLPKERLKLQFILLVKENCDSNVSFVDISQLLGTSLKKIKEWADLYEQGGLNVLLNNGMINDSSYQQKSDNDDFNIDTQSIKKWITDNFITKNEFSTEMNTLKQDRLHQEETVDVLKRVIKILRG